MGACVKQASTVGAPSGGNSAFKVVRLGSVYAGGYVFTVTPEDWDRAGSELQRINGLL